jgi:hypothetical protein
MSATEITVGIIGWVAGVLSTVVGESLNNYLKRLKMNVIPFQQILTNTPALFSVALGFGITIEQGKALDNAYARFNNIIYPWWENGKIKVKTQLLVGEDPSWIFPYYISLKYIEDISKQQNGKNIIRKGDPSNHAILFSVYDYDPDPNKNALKNKIFERIIVMPKNAKAFNIGMNQLLSKISIRLMAEGIEKKMEYKGEIKIKGLSIGKLEDGIPSLDTTSTNFIVYHY